MYTKLAYQLDTLLIHSQQLHNMVTAISDAMEFAPSAPGTYNESVKLLETLMEEHSARIFQMIQDAGSNY